MYPRILISSDMRIKPPLFSSENNLLALLKEVFKLSDDFKYALLAEYNK